MENIIYINQIVTEYLCMGCNYVINIRIYH